MVGAPSAGDEHRSDDQVRVGHCPFDRSPVGRQRRDATLVDLVHPAQPVQVLVQEQDLGLHPGGDPGRVPPDVTGTEDHHPTGPHARRAAQQHASPAGVPLQEVGADLGRHAAGHLGHRRQERQAAVVDLDGLVGDAGDIGVEQRGCHLGVGRQVQVGEEHLAGPEEPVLGRLRFLDLAHQVRSTPHRCRVGHDLGAGRAELFVRDGRVRPGPGLHQHRHVPVGQLPDSVGCDRHPVLVVLHLGGHADGQVRRSSRRISERPTDRSAWSASGR